MSGFWDDEDTARRKFAERVGMYGSDQARVELVEETAAGERQVLETWPDSAGSADG